MGFLYVKVIETKKVAIRSSFYVNYPFVRLLLNGKEQKNTNFRAGIEWWDKIFCFRIFKYTREDHFLIAQARDKSIHVFGSDWIGEINIPLKDVMDGHVHQKWFKLGKGRKSHPKQPRGYIHLAFNYFEESAEAHTRPFSTAPVEQILTFEEYLSAEGEMWGEERHASWVASSQEDINPSPAVSQCAKKNPRTPKTKVSKPKSRTTTPKSDKMKKRGTPKAKKNSDIKDNVKENTDSESDYEHKDIRSSQDLIDFDDAPTVKSDINGMFPPIAGTEFLPHNDMYYPPAAYSLDQLSPSQDQFGNDYSRELTQKLSKSSLQNSHDVRDVGKSSDDNGSDDYQKKESVSPKKSFRHQSTGKNPFLFDADPFSSSVGAH